MNTLPQRAPASLHPCEPGDIAEITAIYAEAVTYGTASFELEAPDVEEMLRRRAALVEAGYPYIVAKSGGSLVGYAYAGAYRARPAYRGTIENSVYVHPEMKGRGLGRLLLLALIDESERLGFRQMVAVIGDSENVASRRLHEAVGFESTGVLKSVGWKHGRWLDTVLMQRPIGPGDSLPR
jgi:phosphinothricin acetyltransferase